MTRIPETVPESGFFNRRMVYYLQDGEAMYDAQSPL